MVEANTIPASSRTIALAAALRTSIGLLRRRLRQTPIAGDLTLPETAALARLDRAGATTAAEMARAEEISPQSMGATLAGLEGRGLIERAADPADGRRAVLTITEAGAEALTHRRDARTDQLATAIEEEFTPEEREQLARAVPLLERLAQRF